MAFPKRYQESTAPTPRKVKAATVAKAQRKRAEEARAEEARAEEEQVERPPVQGGGSDRILVAFLICAAFFAAYGYALSARDARASAGALAAPKNLDPNAKQGKGVQTLYIDASNGFNPQTVFAKPDIPIKIRFGPGQGCYYGVQFPQFNIYKDLRNGGATIDLPKLKEGQYQYACGMNMVYGLLVVRK